MPRRRLKRAIIAQRELALRLEQDLHLFEGFEMGTPRLFDDESPQDRGRFDPDAFDETCATFAVFERVDRMQANSGRLSCAAVHFMRTDRFEIGGVNDPKPQRPEADAIDDPILPRSRSIDDGLDLGDRFDEWMQRHIVLEVA